MKPSATTERPAPGFPVTRWSMVAGACEASPADSAAALEDLCRIYWMPLYAAVRRMGHDPEDAQDLTQEFFVRLLEKHWLNAADREKGHFRTFLMVVLKRFLANEWHRGQAAKRGGRIEHEYRATGRGAEFDALKPCLTASRGEIDYRELATRLETSEGAARVAVHRLRKRYRGLFREEIARTVRDEAEIEEEMRTLMQALAT